MNTAKSPGSSISEQRACTFRRKLLAWFSAHGREFAWRNASASPYLRLVVEVLLQRTRVETIAAFLPGFLSQFPGWSEIAACDTDTLGEVLKPIGLWRRRAPALHGLACELVSLGEKWPRYREHVERIPAVGQYVANAALLFIHGEPHPLMDSSMARLLRRYFVIKPEKADIRHDKPLHAVACQVLAKGHAIELNWAMLDIAAIYCKPRLPACTECPLKRSCAHYRSAMKSLRG